MKYNYKYIQILDVAGFTKPYPLVDDEFCFNANCNCDLNLYNPVCGSDGVEYLTPCQAGCSSYQNENKVRCFQIKQNLVIMF